MCVVFELQEFYEGDARLKNVKLRLRTNIASDNGTPEDVLRYFSCGNFSQGVVYEYVYYDAAVKSATLSLRQRLI